MRITKRQHYGTWSSLLRPWVFMFFALSIAACQQGGEKLPGPPEKITIAYSTLPYTSLFHIAFVKGFFAAEGLDVTPQPYEFGMLTLDALLEGKADLATPADTPVMFAITGGKGICVVATIATSDKATAIVARKDRGVGKPSDLRGKRIGVALGTSAEFFLDSFLSTRGINRKEVKLVDVKPDEMAEALTKGRIDAVSVWFPVLGDMQKMLGAKGLVFYDDTIYSDHFCLTAWKEFVKKRPETVKKVLKALIKAEAFMKDNPEESHRLIAQFIKTDKELLDEIWNSLDFRVTLDQPLIVSLEDQTRWAQRNRLTSGQSVPNYLDFIYFDGLQSVRPDAVRIIR